MELKLANWSHPSAGSDPHTQQSKANEEHWDAKGDLKVGDDDGWGKKKKILF